MGRIPNLKRLRARTTEEQMLATMLVTGLVFAAVSLVAFLRPGASGSTASAKGPEIRGTARSQPRDNSSASSDASSSSADTAAAQQARPPADASITQKPQGLFASVPTPQGFNTNLPSTLQPTPASVAAVPATFGATTTTFPTSFQPSLPSRGRTRAHKGRGCNQC